MRTEVVTAKFDRGISPTKIVIIGSMLTFFSLIALGVSTAYGGSALPGWGSSYEAGMQAAKAQNKPLIVVIAREDCEACLEYERELLKPASQQALRNAIKVRVEADANPSLTQRYAAMGTPTTIVFTPAAGYASPAISYTGVLDAGYIGSLGRSREFARAAR